VATFSNELVQHGPDRVLLAPHRGEAHLIQQADVALGVRVRVHRTTLAAARESALLLEPEDWHSEALIRLL
jgi:hypothetical protein